MKKVHVVSLYNEQEKGSSIALYNEQDVASVCKLRSLLKVQEGPPKV